MRKIYYLKSCSTCQRIIKTLNQIDTFTLQDIKTNPLTEAQLEELYKLAGSYEALFSKRATLYKERGLKNKTLTEQDYKTYLLEHYTFLSRPVLIIDNHLFIGNSPKSINAAQNLLQHV